MSIAQHSLAEAGIAQLAAKEESKKAPPRRTVTALADQRLTPEPR